jgi:type IV pilus assembly protein PilB
MGIEPFLISASVIIIVAQRLARKICAECREEEKVPVPALIKLGVPEEEAGTFRCYKGKGCISCNGSGYRGRTALYEVLPITSEIREMVLEGASSDDLKKTAIRLGMKSLRMSGLTKVKEGVTSIEEVMRVTFGD